MYTENISDIEFGLKKLFENVSINEFSKNQHSFVSINANSVFKYGADLKRMEAKVLINKRDLDKNVIYWSYSTNPLDENAIWIDKSSKSQNLVVDIFETVSSLKFDIDYLEALPAQVEVIAEKNTKSIDAVVIALEKCEVVLNLDINEENKYFYEGELKLSTKLKIEQELKKITNNPITFNSNYIYVSA